MILLTLWLPFFPRATDLTLLESSLPSEKPPMYGLFWLSSAWPLTKWDRWIEVGESGKVAIEERRARLDWACCSSKLCDDREGGRTAALTADGGWDGWTSIGVGRYEGKGTRGGPGVDGACVLDVLCATECVTEVTGVTVEVDGANRGFQRWSMGIFRLLEARELTEGGWDVPLEDDPGPETRGGFNPVLCLRDGDVEERPPADGKGGERRADSAVSTVKEAAELEARGFSEGEGKEPDDLRVCPVT